MENLNWSTNSVQYFGDFSGPKLDLVIETRETEGYDEQRIDSNPRTAKRNLITYRERHWLKHQLKLVFTFTKI